MKIIHFAHLFWIIRALGNISSFRSSQANRSKREKFPFLATCKISQSNCTGSVGTWSETWFAKLTSFKPIILAIFHDKQTLANIYFLTFFSNTTDFRRKFSMAFVKKTILFILRVFSWCNNLTRVDVCTQLHK